ncbi:hypothetical protein [Fusobacterium nucleatum]|uniref:hypothetical protein n=1 Tax=uncultured Fusobacterium sp. TaxID=159267 RepID=UPI002361870F|nr:hypothetical protein [Fusobacterium nucleatum]WDA45107.1 hypothetical protein PSR67_05425 [Fusobacterium nucleatum]
MGSIVAILLFLLSLITCLLLKFSVVYALVIGYIIFIIYELWKRKNKIFIWYNVLKKKREEDLL